MIPDEKYMSEANLKENLDFPFTPPPFNRNFLRDNTNSENDNNFLNLYPDETEDSELYCYYNVFNGCNKNELNNSNNTENRIPTPFDILRGLDLDFEETLNPYNNSNDVDKIYSEIEQKNPGIYDTFSKYGVPDPISQVITKRLIKLTLLYYDKE